jgi:tRNA(adenine34) deaminase
MAPKFEVKAMAKKIAVPCPFLPFAMEEIPLCDEDWMKLAYNEALNAWKMDEVPVGAIVTREGAIVGMAHNCVETEKDPTGHCEMLAMRRAAKFLGAWRLNECTLYVTKEPCPMCSGACVMARVGRVVFAVSDKKMGCLGGSGYNFSGETKFNHEFSCTSGVLAQPCQDLLQSFFRLHRQ